LKPGIDFARGRKHWAFQPLREINAKGIDAFLLEKLKAKGLRYAQPADRRTLLRRVTFDLTGLPPTPDEVDAFLSDRLPGAYRKVVDRLLASPQYGERWARHWLDLVRYAETDGHEFDVDKPNTWRYRDWVIRALNSDLPYDRFVRYQIAGDRIGGADPSIASAFWWLGEVINTPVDTFQALADRVDNSIDVFGKAFLGLTVACARCHDHKFDPIPASDYYALAGFVQSSRPRQVCLSQAGQAPALKGVGHEWISTGPAFGPGPVEGILHSGRYSNKLQGILISRQFVIKERYVHVRLAGKGNVRLYADEYTNGGRVVSGGDIFAWKTIDARMGQGNIAYLSLEDLDPDSYIAVDRIVFSDDKNPPPNDGPDRPPDPESPGMDAPAAEFALSAVDDVPKDVRVHLRGSHTNLGDAAPRRFLTVLSGETQPPVTQGSGRLELARRVLEDARPLLARVMVNRIWKHHFGAGLVETVDNFGLTGDRPTHPELLDWLAGEFIRSGWSIKHLHRTMLLSAAYRMSSRPGPTADAADPRNQLLHRMPVRRLEAEAIRDNMLAVAGVLDRTMHGPPVTPFVSPYMDGDPRGKPKSGPLDGSNRRSLYINVRRNYLSDMFLTFDYPQPTSTIGKRGQSTVASQALYLMNNEFAALQAGRWASGVMQVSDLRERVTRMYEQAFSRKPEPSELDAALDFLKRNTLADYAHVLLNTTEFIYIR
jgi:hypothetical protein